MKDTPLEGTQLAALDFNPVGLTHVAQRQLTNIKLPRDLPCVLARQSVVLG